MRVRAGHVIRNSHIRRLVTVALGPIFPHRGRIPRRKLGPSVLALLCFAQHPHYGPLSSIVRNALLIHYVLHCRNQDLASQRASVVCRLLKLQLVWLRTAFLVITVNPQVPGLAAFSFGPYFWQPAPRTLGLRHALDCVSVFRFFSAALLFHEVFELLVHDPSHGRRVEMLKVGVLARSHAFCYMIIYLFCYCSIKIKNCIMGFWGFGVLGGGSALLHSVSF